MNKKTIHIVSFGHRYGPLSPTPTLSYDIRDIPNPPREYRLQQTASKGATSALRQWLMNNEVFIERIGIARRDILDLIGRRDSEGNVGGDVVVGVNCHLGRHRSVTFVEELGRRLREDLGGMEPAWEVRVRHRELEKRM